MTDVQKMQESVGSTIGEESTCHPLNTKWTLWFDCQQKKTTSDDQWEQNLKAVVTVDSVESFWGALNNIQRPSQLSYGSNFHFFREGIKPAWEDPANDGGGRLLIKVDNNQRDLMDRLWTYVCMCCVGESSEYSHLVTGCVASSRRVTSRITIWLRKCDDQATIDSLIKQMSELIQLPAGHHPIDFQLHKH